MLNRTTRVAASSRTLAMPWQGMLIKLGFVEMVAAALLISSLLSGCSGGCSSEQPRPIEDPVVKRMEDPEYVKQINDLRAAQKEIAKRTSEALRDLEAARAEDEESEKTKELEKKYKATLDEQERLRQLSMTVIRNRIQKDAADEKAAREKAKKK